MSQIARFSIGGTANTALGVELLPSFKEPVLPKTRDRSIEIPGRHGRYMFSSDLQAREIVLDLVVIDATTPETLQSLSRAFAAVLLDQDGHPEDVALVFTKEASKTYTVRYSGNLPLQRLIGGSMGYFSLPLIAPDPFSYGAEDTDTATITAAYQTMAVVNAGDYRTPPVYTITVAAGSSRVTGFTLTVEGSGGVTQSFAYTGTLIVGDVLEIDVDNMTVEVNGVNARPLFSGDFPLLYVGNNDIHWNEGAARGRFGSARFGTARFGSVLRRDVDLEVVHRPRYL